MMFLARIFSRCGWRWLICGALLAAFSSFASIPKDNALGQLVSAQAFESTGALRLNENLAYTYDASGNLATRANNTLLQTFAADTQNQLSTITRTGTVTVAGSVTGAVSSVYVNGHAAALYSDATYEGDPSVGEKPGWQMTPEERKASAGDRTRMQPQPRPDSNAQGGEKAKYSKDQKKELGL
jgi:hypothetical protein